MQVGTQANARRLMLKLYGRPKCVVCVLCPLQHVQIFVRYTWTRVCVCVCVRVCVCVCVCEYVCFVPCNMSRYLCDTLGHVCVCACVAISPSSKIYNVCTTMCGIVFLSAPLYVLVGNVCVRNIIRCSACVPTSLKMQICSPVIWYYVHHKVKEKVFNITVLNHARTGGRASYRGDPSQPAPPNAVRAQSHGRIFRTRARARGGRRGER